MRISLPIDYPSASPALRKLVREKYVSLQDNLCYHCKAPLDQSPAEEVQALKVNRRRFPPDFFKWPVHLHHSHVTGLTIGTVHSHCNAVLWQYFGE